MSNRSIILLFVAITSFFITPVHLSAQQQRGPKRKPAQKTAPQSTEPRVPDAIARQPHYENVHVLCIGVDHEQSGMFDTLSFAESDAQAVADLFRDKYGYQVQTLLGDEATLKGINDKVSDYMRTLHSKDVFIFFFAGHAHTAPTRHDKQIGYLVPADFGKNASDKLDLENPDTAYSHGVAMGSLSGKLIAMKAMHVLLLLDCCFSGVAAEATEGIVGDSGEMDVFTIPTRQVITAGSAKQEAWEDLTIGQGYFTRALLNELNKNTEGITFEGGLYSGIYGELQRAPRPTQPQHRDLVRSNGSFLFEPLAAARKIDLPSLQKQVSEAAAARGASKMDEADFVEVSDPAARKRAMEGEDDDAIKRFEEYQKQAAAGDAVAMASLYYCYAYGIGTEKDAGMARNWAMEAHQAGHGGGHMALADAYENGYGVKKNAKKAQRHGDKARETDFGNVVGNLLKSKFGRRLSGRSQLMPSLLDLIPGGHDSLAEDVQEALEALDKIVEKLRSSKYKDAMRKNEKFRDKLDDVSEKALEAPGHEDQIRKTISDCKEWSNEIDRYLEEHKRDWADRRLKKAEKSLRELAVLISD